MGTKKLDNSTQTPLNDSAIEYYSDKAEDLAARYESASFEEIHAQLIPFLPPQPARILDVGAGSGRDAAAFANRGYEVTAVEPAERLLKLARKLHPNCRIEWRSDRLPELQYIVAKEVIFDAIWLSGVWMHLTQEERSKAFENMKCCLKPDGTIFLSYREGEENSGPSYFSMDEIAFIEQAESANLEVLKHFRSSDQFGRSDVKWHSFVLKWRG